MIRHLFTALLLISAGATQTRAQAAPDSFAIWTSQLGRGTDGARAEALGRLSARGQTATLPSATQLAMIAELRRVNASILAIPKVPWNDDATGEYYMSLVDAVASLETVAAYRALPPSIGVSLGVARRVARLGDETVPVLQGFISRDYETDVALGTLGMAWFWADSTGAPLSLTSRSLILQSFLQAYGTPSNRMRLGLMMGLEYANDPTLLPLARALEAKAKAANDVFVINSLAPVIAVLEKRGSGVPLAALLRSLQRNVQSVCVTTSSGQRRGFCQSVQNELASALGHVEQRNEHVARAGLASALGSANHARDKGSISGGEHALIAGEITEILSRLR